jgi:hypothetical protein
VAETDKTYDLGYGKPPERTQFVKGKSGNPKGRPKGSQNLATILAKAARQRVKITENGRTRSITKLEAIMLQLCNKGASGDLKATGALLDWIKVSGAESGQAAITAFVPHESDQAVIANIVERIRNAEIPEPGNPINPTAAAPSNVEE